MKYNIVEITEHGVGGKEVWICDYRRNDVNSKAQRHVKPTKVVLLSKYDYEAAGKDFGRVYYSKYAFVQLNKKGEPQYSKKIAPYDTTGFRSFAGIGVNVFDNEAECVAYYNEQVQTVIDMIDNRLRTILIDLQIQKEDTIQLLINTDEESE